MRQLKQCPKCQSLDGWFEKRVEYYDQYFDQHGEPTHATDGGNGRGGVKKYCYNCGRDITKIVAEDDSALR